jgi:DNA-binding CsgD family transcriptional regulator
VDDWNLTRIANRFQEAALASALWSDAPAGPDWAAEAKKAVLVAAEKKAPGASIFADGVSLFAMGFAQILGISNGLQLVGQAAIIFNENGRVVQFNEAAAELIGDIVDPTTREFRFSDELSQSAFDSLLGAALEPEATSGPAHRAATVRDGMGRRILMQAIILHDGLRHSFPGARVLMLAKEAPAASMRRDRHSRFQFTPGEARLAEALCTGVSLSRAARRLEIAYETARTVLKNIYQKTATHRQGELIALLLSEKYSQEREECE